MPKRVRRVQRPQLLLRISQYVGSYLGRRATGRPLGSASDSSGVFSSALRLALAFALASESIEIFAGPYWYAAPR
jgi:hypothetical protein